MKQIMKKILASVLACSCFMSLFGCDLILGGEKEPAESLQNGEVLFADFESWEPNFQLCRISAGRGTRSRLR